MRVVLDNGTAISIGSTEASPTIGIVDRSRRVTDDFGVTTVVPRGFSRTMSVRVAVPFSDVDAIQRRLAALRATPATWIADERFASLAVRGIYKDFQIDLAVPPLSYCTLTVEGLNETATAADPGGDPAPIGELSTLQLLQPTTITDNMLTDASVAENDAPEWVGGATSYAKGARVIKAATHRIYESLIDANVSNDPASTTGKWLNVGPTNRWAMLDQALGTSTVANGSISISVDAGTTNAIALVDVVAATVRVQAPGYDRTQAAGTGTGTFLDLPTTNGRVTVTITGPGQVSVGTLLVGKLVRLGVTEASPTAAITDYSRKEVDDFGAVTVVPRGWAKRMAAKALIRTDAIDLVANRITAVRTRPSLWIGKAGLDSLTVYGFFKDFSIEVGVGQSKLSLSIEGLSTSAKVEPFETTVDWTDVGNRDGTKPENSATYGSTLGTGGSLGNVKKYTGGLWYEGDLYTAAGIAGGFAGQGAFATISSAAYGSSLLTGFGALAPLASVAFGSSFLRTTGGVIATDALYQTGLGTAAAIAGQTYLATNYPARLQPASYQGDFNDPAYTLYPNGLTVAQLRPGEANANVTESRSAAAIAGQGAFATVSSAAYGSSLLTGFGALAPLASIAFGSSFLRTAGGVTATDAAYQTGLGTAAAIAGQTYLATNYPARLQPASYQGDFNDPAYTLYPNGLTVAQLRPGEANANVTENRAAAAIAGQAATATSSDFAVLTGATKPANNATNDLVLVAAGNVPPIVLGNSARGRSANDWTGYVTTRGIAGGVRARAVLGSGIMFGITGRATVQDPGRTFASISFAVYNAGSDGWYVFSDGANVASLGSAFSDATQWEWTADGATVKLFADGATSPVYSFPLNYSGMLYAAAAFLTTNTVGQLSLSAHADTTRQNMAAAIAGQGSLATLSQVTLNTTTIRRADGTTIVSETLVVTTQGTAAAIAGQGKGATANKLSDLDAVAAGQLAGAQANQRQTAGYAGSITRTLEPGASISFEAAVYREAGGNTGTLKCRVRGGPAGGAQSDLAVGPGVTVSASEPGGDQVSGSFTNNTNMKQAFTFALDDVRQPTTAGGSVRASQSYLLA